MRTLAAFALLAVATAGSQARSTEPRLLERVALPGVQGRIDHMAFDAAAQKLYVAALGNNTVEVVDVHKGVHLKSLPGFREPQGIAVADDAHLVSIANGEGKGIEIVHASDYRVVRTVALGDDSDNVRYNPGEKRVYVGYGGGAIAAIDPTTGQVIGRASLPDHPESFQLERAGTRIYVNVPNAEQVAVIDRTTMKVIATWPVTAAGANFPMALDETHHRLFIGCRQPARVLVYDTRKGAVLGGADIVGDTDDLFYDPQPDRLYVSGGQGFLDVLDVKDSTHPVRLAHLATAPGARTSLFAPSTGHLYLAVPHRGAQQAEIRAYAVRE